MISKIKREKYHIYLDKDNIVHYEEQNKITTDSLRRAAVDLEKILNSPSKPTRTLLDLRSCDLKRALRLRKELLKIARLAERVKKLAVYTDNKLLWILTNFLYSAIGRKDVKQLVVFFNSEEKALEWLKKKDTVLS